MRNRRRNRRSGFTLMEILLVAAILVIMASMATYAFLSMGRTATSDLAKSEIKSFANACDVYFMRHQRFPNSLNDLFAAPNGMTPVEWGGPFMKGDALDPWKNDYKYQQDTANDRVIISSYGPNGSPGGGDDITNVAQQGTAS